MITETLKKDFNLKGENIMKVRVKQRIELGTRYGVTVNVEPGEYDAEMLLKSINNNSGFYSEVAPLSMKFFNNYREFEIIDDWKPDPYHKDNTLCYGTNKYQVENIVYYNRRLWVHCLTQKEAALRKLKQIANHLNGDWKPDWKNPDQLKHYICFNYETNQWCTNYNYWEGSSIIYFKEMNAKILQQIVSWMNNGDGICMNDLLED